MKINVRQIDYDGNLCSTGQWWKWTEICDRCNKECETSNLMTMTKPNITEKDYCLTCLKILLKERRKELQ